MEDFKLTRVQVMIIFTAVLASLLEIIDTSIVNVAIPNMMGNLGATLEDVSWVVTGYIIANAIVLPIAGWLGMQIGRKKYYVGCILAFTATSVACGLAPNLATLAFFRVLQGLAGGALLPTSQALIQEQFPREKAGMASAIFGMGVILGPTIGPTLGGYLTDEFGWRAIFNINLPLGIFAAVMAYNIVGDVGEKIVLKPKKSKNENVSSQNATEELVQQDAPKPTRVRTPIDFFGLALLVLGIGSLQFVLERGQSDDWFASDAILICTIIAVAALPIFIWWELKIKHPIINIRLFLHPAVRSGTAMMMALGLMLYSTVFVLPIFVNNILNYTATQTGILFIPGALITALMMPMVGTLLKKIDARLLILTGMIIIEAFLYLLTELNATSTDHQMFMPLIVRGFGMAFLFVPINSVVLSQFSGSDLGQVAGLMNLMRQIGGSVGIAVLSSLLQALSAKNYTLLLSRISLLNPILNQQLLGSEAAFASKLPQQLGVGIQKANEMAAYKMLYFRIQKQVFCLSFSQIIWVLIFSFGLALIPLFFIKPPKKLVAVDAH